jgi:hypothetical protein
VEDAGKQGRETDHLRGVFVKVDERVDQLLVVVALVAADAPRRRPAHELIDHPLDLNHHRPLMSKRERERVRARW